MHLISFGSNDQQVFLLVPRSRESYICAVPARSNRSPKIGEMEIRKRKEGFEMGCR